MSTATLADLPTPRDGIKDVGTSSHSYTAIYSQLPSAEYETLLAHHVHDHWRAYSIFNNGHYPGNTALGTTPAYESELRAPAQCSIVEPDPFAVGGRINAD